MPPLPSNASIWYWPSSTVSTIDAGSASSTSPSIEQKLTLSSYFALQAVQYFIRRTASSLAVVQLGVNAAHVVFNHPVTVVLRREGLNRALHHCNPLTRQFALVARIKKRHHFLLECPIQRLRVQCIHRGNVR